MNGKGDIPHSMIAQMSLVSSVCTQAYQNPRPSNAATTPVQSLMMKVAMSSWCLHPERMQDRRACKQATAPPREKAPLQKGARVSTTDGG